MTLVTSEVKVPLSLDLKRKVIVPFDDVLADPDAMFPDGKVIVK